MIVKEYKDILFFFLMNNLNEHENSEEIIEKKQETLFNKIKKNQNTRATIYFSTNLFCGIGFAYSVQFVYQKRNEIIIVFFATSCVVTSFFIILQLFQLYHIIKDSLSKIDEQDRIREFLEKEYKTFENIYSDSTLKEYKNEDKNFLSELKKVDLHFHETMPFDYNKELIIFYNNETESFDYYSANSDIHYKFLNSTCRSYVLKYKCINLFQDDLDIKRFSCDEEEDEDYEKIQDSAEEEEEEKYDTKETRNSIFYVKKTRQEKEKKKQPIEKRINKFIYKGNMKDYYNLFLKDKREQPQDMSYEKYKELQENSDSDSCENSVNL